uniref:Xyloside xylosyltransferase 1 n=1 Tax=Cuerna arida TaxID=1464854 RepID=A0A1B6G689_9HEMI
MSYKILLNLILLVSFLVIFYVVQTNKEQTDAFKNQQEFTDTLEAGFSTPVTKSNFSEVTKLPSVSVVDKYFNIWCIFTKVKSRSSSLRYKFETLIKSIFESSSIKLSFHIISDSKSQYFAEKIFDDINSSATTPIEFKVQYHDVKNITSQLSGLTSTMLPYFSSQPGAYYSDALFFISLGLHRVAPAIQTRAVLLDVDTKLVDDIALLFQEFNRFGERAVLGIAPELSPVYQHILYSYRSRHKHTPLGSPLSLGGFPGVNSGVLLLHLDRLRASAEYNHLLTPQAVRRLANKYSFKGHLGDQDWYTLVGMDRPHLLHLLPCGWNRQLCDWWRDHGYRDVFDSFAYCSQRTRLYHGNCNTPIPRD